MEQLSEHLTTRAINSGIKRGSMMIVEGCLEVMCSLCKEFLPHTKEFFYSNGKNSNRLKSKCKACWFDTRHFSQIPPTTIKGRPKKVNRYEQ